MAAHPELILENSDYKILYVYDFNIYAYSWISARRPDIVFMNKCTRTTKLIDIAWATDTNVEWEKIKKYVDLKLELQCLWQCNVQVIPLVLGALGCLSLFSY